MLQGYFANKWGDKLFEKEIAQIVKRHALWGSLIMMLPIPIVDTIVYCFILWDMYSSLCKKAGTTLKASSIIVGIVVNVLITVVVDLALTLIPVIGWLGTGFIVYLQFYLSGKAYIETLRKM